MIPSELKDKIKQAQVLYFSDYTIAEIATITEMPIDNIRMLAFGDDGTGRDMKCWKTLKARLDPVSIATYIIDKRNILERTTGLAVTALSKGLQNLNDKVMKGDIELSVADMKDLAAIVTSMDKIVRLESGTATDIISKIGLTPAEARKILAEDPFAQSVVNMEVEYVRVNEKTGREDRASNGHREGHRDNGKDDKVK